MKKIIKKEVKEIKMPEVLQCNICQGKGRVSDKLSCEVCQGTGVIK